MRSKFPFTLTPRIRNKLYPCRICPRLPATTQPEGASNLCLQLLPLSSKRGTSVMALWERRFCRRECDRKRPLNTQYLSGKHRVPISSGPAPGVYGASGPAPVCKGPCRQSKIHVGGGRGWSTALSKALGAGAAGAGRFSRIFWSVYRFLVVSLLFISYLPSPCLIFIKVASTFLGYA